MPNLSQSEINSIREVVMGHQVMHCKLTDYANQCQDAQIKQMFQKSAQEAQIGAQKLLQML